MQKHALATTELETVVGLGTTRRGKPRMSGTGGWTVTTVVMTGERFAKMEASEGRHCRELCRSAKGGPTMTGATMTGARTDLYLTQHHGTRTEVKSSM